MSSALLDPTLLKPTTKRTVVARVVQYLYFTRFAWGFWLGLIALPMLDLCGISSAYTRGFFVLEQPKQFVSLVFYIVFAGWVALVVARVVCAYGEERFSLPCPEIFFPSLMSAKALGISQGPGIALIVYSIVMSRAEGNVSLPVILRYSLIGLCIAVILIYLSNYFYLLLRSPGDDSSVPPLDLALPMRWLAFDNVWRKER
jgi:hypothetical protein